MYMSLDASKQGQVDQRSHPEDSLSYLASCYWAKKGHKTFYSY